MSVDIFVARHGQGEDNAKGILGGHRDKPLTSLGRNQARNLARGIINAGLAFDIVYSSPLSRALETAKIVTELLKLPEPIILDDLIERDFGFMTGKPIKDIEELCGPNILKVGSVTYFLDSKDSESFPQSLKRAKKVVKEIYKQHTDGKVLLVCHGDIGTMIYAAVTNQNWRDALTKFDLGNAELVDLSSNGDVRIINLSGLITNVKYSS